MTFDGSKPGPPLTSAEQSTIIRLNKSDFLTDTEKQQLSLMLAAGHKGVFEQEARPLAF